MDVKKDLQLLDPELSSMEEDNSDNDDETWDEIDAESENQIICLFCPQIFKTMAVALEHCKMEHHFNLVDMKVKFNMDCYSYICMVNYIRKEGIVPEVIISSSKEAPWLNECYLTPVLQDDPWLMFDFDGLESPVDSEIVDASNDFLMNALTNVKHENGLVTMSESSFAYLQQSLKYYAEQVQKKENMLATAIDQIGEMKSVAAKLVCGDLTNEDLENKILTMKLSEDNGYFRTYSHFGIHHEMLSDEVRMVSFRDAIIMNTSVFSNKTVLDVGCGSGILSMFAANANADKVFGVDQSDIIHHANDIVRENDLSSKIDLIHGKVENVDLPVQKVDIIVSEWLGYFLLFEGMLDSVLYARDKYLKPDGHMLPNRCCLFLAGVSDPESYQKMIGFWRNVYGYKMSCLAKEVLREALVVDISPESVVTSSALVFDLNLYVHTVNDTNFTSDFALECHIDGELTALCGYFSVIFNLPHEVSFSTSPSHPKTHWKQTVFYLPTPITVQKGTTVNGQINCKRKLEDNRSLIITIQIANQRNVYVLA